MNNSYQVEILQQQRVIQAPGIFYLPSLSMGLLRWSYDSKSNMALSYSQKAEHQKQKHNQNQNQSSDENNQNTKNNIKLTFKLYSSLNSPLVPNKVSSFSSLSDIYIIQTNNFIEKLLVDKLQKNKKRINMINLFNNKKIMDDEKKNQKDSVKFYVIKLLNNLIETRAAFNQKLLQFYKKDPAFYEDQITSFTNKKNLYDYHRLILSEIETKASFSELITFMNVCNQNLTDIEDSKKETVIMAYQPNLGELALFINPIVLTILENILTQVKYEQEKKKKIINKNAQNQKQKQKQKQNPKLKQPLDILLNPQNSDSVFTYCGISSSYFQKIVFVDLDGEDNFYALDIFKSLWKYIMYVSFPKNYQNFDDFSYVQTWLSYSQMNMQSYFSKVLTKQKIKETLNKHKINQVPYTKSGLNQTAMMDYTQSMLKNEIKKYLTNQQELRKKLQNKGDKQEIKKNLFIFPLSSPALNNINTKIKKCSTKTIQHESNFVYNILCNYIDKIINDFVPSLIIVSYSGKIYLENHHFRQIIKMLTVKSNNRILFYPNMSKIFVDGERSASDLPEDIEDIFDYLTQPLKKYEKDLFNLSKNDDLLQKIEIFQTVTSGKSNLEKVRLDRTELEKYSNIQTKEYTAELMKQLGTANNNIKRLSNDLNDEISLYHAYRKAYKYEQLPSYLSEDSFVKRLLNKLKQMLLSDMEQESNYQNQIQYIRAKYKKDDMKCIFQQYQTSQYIRQFSYKVRPIIYLKLAWKQYDVYSPYDNLQPVRFFIRNANNNGQIQFVDLDERVQILYHSQSSINLIEKDRSVIYVMNHLENGREWKNYYAFITPASHQSQNILKVQNIELYELYLPLEELPHQFATYSDWNYCETTHKHILYWPIKYDFINQQLNSFSKISHKPDSMLCSDFFISDKKQSGNFQRLQCSYKTPLTRCNSVSYQSDNNIQIYIFGCQAYTSAKYQSNDSQILKVIIDIRSSQPIIQSLKFKDQNIIMYHSEYQVYKNQDTVFLLGGYGTQYGSLFQPVSAFFYQIKFKQLQFTKVQDTKYNNKKWILKHDMNIINDKIRATQIKKQNEQYEISHQPINVRLPLKVREKMSCLGVVHKTDGQIHISKESIPNKADNGYIVQNYINFIIEEDFQSQKKNLYRLSSFREYHFVDSTYYENSKLYNQALYNAVPEANHHFSMGTELTNDSYLKMKFGQNFSEKFEMDFKFSPTPELKERRSAKFKEIFSNDSIDHISSIESIDKNNRSVIIMFTHPRITMGRSVIASYDLFGNRSTDNQKKTILFRQTVKLSEEFWDQMQGWSRCINSLNNFKIILWCWKGRNLNAFEINQSYQRYNIILSEVDSHRDIRFLTYTYQDIILCVKYHSQSFGQHDQLIISFFFFYQNPKPQPQQSNIQSSQNRYILQSIGNQQYRVKLKKRFQDDSKLQIIDFQNIHYALFGKKLQINLWMKYIDYNKEFQKFNLTIEGVSLDNFPPEANDL